MISTEISKYMQEHQMDVNRLSQLSGLSTASLQQAFDGQRNLSIEEYAAVCKALELPLEYFFPKKRCRTA